jgi:predicted phosphodiesterase
MRVACLYDIHGNLPALEAVVRDVRREAVDRIVVGGDVMPGPMPRECLDLLKTIDVPTDYIIGNGDRETLAARRGQLSATIPEYFRESMTWNARQLNADDERTVGAWPPTLTISVGTLGQALFCHATPRNDTEIFTSATSEAKLLPIFDVLDVNVVVCGHVHMQFDRMVGRTRVINAGSVGMPFQQPGAYWLLLDNGIGLRRTDYDLKAAADRIRATKYPLADDFASKNVLSTPSMESMLTAFASAELT